MKVLIWLSCLFIVAIIHGFIDRSLEASEIILGPWFSALLACIQFPVFWYTASWLCRKWDIRVFEMKASRQKLTPGGYASIIYPSDLLDRCEAAQDDVSEFENILRQNIEGEIITKSDANVLRYMFRDRKGK